MFNSFLNGLETKFGRFAIPGLLRVIAFFNGLVFVLIYFSPALWDALTLDLSRVASGEVWRLLTFVFLPATLHPLWIIFALLIMVLCGDALERAWGSFKLNVYYFTGMIATIIAAVIVSAVAGDYAAGATHNGVFLNASVFFAFATLFPMVEFRIYFILPVQVRWLALIQGLVFLGFLITSPLPHKVAIIVALSNYFLFFGPTFMEYMRTRKQITERRAKFEAASLPEDEPLHRCKVCGATEQTDQYLDFRVAGDGEEYCENHLPGKATTAS